jgi:hypothetical protein
VVCLLAYDIAAAIAFELAFKDGDVALRKQGAVLQSMMAWLQRLAG